MKEVWEQDTEHKVQSTGYRGQSREHTAQSAECRIQTGPQRLQSTGWEHRAQSVSRTEHGVRSTVDRLYTA